MQQSERVANPTIGPRRRVYVFTDESGNLDFSRKRDATRYFILTSITTRSCDFGARLLDLRRQLAWEGHGLNEEWHASKNADPLRRRIFGALLDAEFVIDATVFDKHAISDYYTKPTSRFYEFAWYWHFGEIAPKIVERGDELLVVSASLGDKQTRKASHTSVGNAVALHVPDVLHRTAHWKDDSDPCLIGADYCSWALFRKWEYFSPFYYSQIATRVRTELDFCARRGIPKEKGRG